MSTLREFISIYAAYRKHHGALYAARTAWRCAIRGVPF